MAKGILIAEKPSLMRTIQTVYNANKSKLGYELDFLAQAGHIVTLKMPDEINPALKKWSFDNLPLDYHYAYKIIPGKEELAKSIQAAINSGKYDFVVHAGDADNEGELLVRLPLMLFNNKLPVKRFWTNSLADSDVLAALQNLFDDKLKNSTYEAALLRSHVDNRYGMNLTVALSVKLNMPKTVIRIGRVKAAIVSLVVAREKEIKEFNGKPKYLEQFLYKDCAFVRGDKEYATEADAKAGLPKADSAKVLSAEEKNSSKSAPKLYNIASLQMAANEKYKMSAKHTQDIVQTLYEKKLLTYPRTSCEYISPNIDGKTVFQNVKKYLELECDFADWDAVKTNTRYANEKEVNKESHTAIIPTDVKTTGELTGDEAKIYELVARRFAAIFAKEKKIHSVKVTADCGGHEFEYSDSEDVEPGYELVLDPNYKKKVMPHVSFVRGMEMKPITLGTKEVKPKAPSRYTDGSLIKKMENPGEEYEDEQKNKTKFSIGTPATRAAIIEECVSTGYITKEKNSFVATPLAEKVVETFGFLPLFDIVTSGHWESLIANVKNGTANRAEIEEMLIGDLNSQIEDLRKIQTIRMRPAGLCKCPKCKTGDLYKSKNKPLYFCGNWNNEANKCQFGLYEEHMGHKFTAKEVENLCAGKTITIHVTKKDGSKDWDQKVKLVLTENWAKIDHVMDKTKKGAGKEL